MIILRNLDALYLNPFWPWVLDPGRGGRLYLAVDRFSPPPQKRRESLIHPDQFKTEGLLKNIRMQLNYNALLCVVSYYCKTILINLVVTQDSTVTNTQL